MGLTERYEWVSGVVCSFLQTAERSSTHGCHFYQVRDKAGQPWTVGISNKGIFQYDPADISKPKKVLYLPNTTRSWMFLHYSLLLQFWNHSSFFLIVYWNVQRDDFHFLSIKTVDIISHIFRFVNTSRNQRLYVPNMLILLWCIFNLIKNITIYVHDENHCTDRYFLAFRLLFLFV